MKELNTFRQFINESKENVDELFGRKKDPIEKQASMVFSTIEFMDDLVSAGHMDKAFFDVFTEKIGEAYSSLMMGASPELQSKMGFEVDVDLDENDAALDEVINEARPNLKKALPTIAARNVERNNAINFDIEEMMDMVGEAGKGEGSEEAKILFKASNASDELEQALVDLQVYFEDDLGEGKDTNDEIEEGVIGQTFRKIFGKQEYKEGDIVFLKKNHREVRVILQAKHGDKSKRNRLDYRTQDEKSNLADPEGNIYYIMSEPQPINVKLTIDNAGFHFDKLDSLSKTGYREGGEKIYQTSIKGEAVWDEGKKRYMPK